jgi:hypothetical protein
MVKQLMGLNLNNLSDTVIPACFWLESSDLRRWMPASAGMTKYSGQQCAKAGIQRLRYIAFNDLLDTLLLQC